MEQLRFSHTPKIWLILALLGAAIFLVSCGNTPEITATPSPEFECPELTCPKPVSYEELWSSSAHADTTAEAFTHWDEDDPQEIPVECAKCHSRPGFIDFLGVDGTKEGIVDNPSDIGTTVTCFVCHNEITMVLDDVTFPSGVRISHLGPEVRCILCHQGRASTDTVEEAILGLDLTDDDAPSDELEFINSHSISGATPFGSQVNAAFEYKGRQYQGRFERGEDFFDCLRCHDQHSLELKVETCSECHTFNGTDVKDIRVDTTDFDGDGDIQEGIAYEIESLHELLYRAIQVYAKETIGNPIAFDASTYPYFFVDINDDGEINAEEAISENNYNTWSPRLLRAAYNYNYISHDPGAFAHNSDYILQVLFDSLADIGGDTDDLHRP